MEVVVEIRRIDLPGIGDSLANTHLFDGTVIVGGFPPRKDCRRVLRRTSAEKEHHHESPNHRGPRGESHTSTNPVEPERMA